MIAAAVIASALLAAVFALNLGVDPYGIFRPMVVRGRARHRPRMIQRDRLHVAFRLRRVRPRCLVLGTSDVLSGIDLNHPWLSDFGPGEKLIVGLQAAPMTELELYLRAAAARAPLRRVVLALDIVSFSARNRPRFFMDYALVAPSATARPRARAWAWVVWEALLRPRTLRRSLEIVAAPGATPPGADGRLAYRDDGGAVYTNTDAGAALSDLLATHVRQSWLYGGLALSDAHFAAFARVVALCGSRSIELHAFVHPCHAAAWLALEELGHGELVASFKRRLAALAAAASPPVPLWVPSGFGPTCAEPPVEGGPMQGYVDCVHLTARTARALFDGLAGGDAGGLELRRLTPDGVEAHLQEERRRLAAYRQGPGAWVVPLVQRVRPGRPPRPPALAEAAPVEMAPPRE